MPPVIVLTTVGSSFDAAAFARELVEARLVACVNLVELVRSIYRWEVKIKDDAEQLLVMKTVDARLDDLKRAVFARHPYEVPEFVVLPIERIEGPYLEWLSNSVS